MNARPLQKRNLTNPARRRFSTGLCLGLLTMVAGCGGSGDDLLSGPTPAGSSPGAEKWDVVPSRSLTLPPGASFNLAATLPSNVRTGGVFQVDPSGAALPAGFTLTPSGLLYVGSSATGGTAGVVFRYTPPA
jgi:hypothetical protein